MSKKRVEECDYQELASIVVSICQKWAGRMEISYSTAIKITNWLLDHAPRVKIKKHPEIVQCAYDLLMNERS